MSPLRFAAGGLVVGLGAVLCLWATASSSPPRERQRRDERPSGAQWRPPPRRPWLTVKARAAVDLSEFEPGFKEFRARLGQELEALRRSNGVDSVPPEMRPRVEDANRDTAYSAHKMEFASWLEDLGVGPRGDRTLLSSDIGTFLAHEARRDPLSAALAMGAVEQDPTAEPAGMLGELVLQPPAASQFVRSFAVETIGLTNRLDYLPLLRDVATGGDASLAGRAVVSAGLMDGGAAKVLRPAIESQETLAEIGGDVAVALARSPDTADAVGLVRDLMASEQDGARDAGLQAMTYRGVPPDLREAVTSVALEQQRDESTRQQAFAAIRQGGSIDVLPTAEAIAADCTASASLRIDAIRAMAALDSSAAVDSVRTFAAGASRVGDVARAIRAVRSRCTPACDENLMQIRRVWAGQDEARTDELNRLLSNTNKHRDAQTATWHGDAPWGR